MKTFRMHGPTLSREPAVFTQLFHLQKKKEKKRKSENDQIVATDHIYEARRQSFLKKWQTITHPNDVARSEITLEGNIKKCFNPLRQKVEAAWQNRLSTSPRRELHRRLHDEFNTG